MKTNQQQKNYYHLKNLSWWLIGVSVMTEFVMTIWAILTTVNAFDDEWAELPSSTCVAVAVIPGAFGFFLDKKADRIREDIAMNTPEAKGSRLHDMLQRLAVLRNVLSGQSLDVYYGGGTIQYFPPFQCEGGNVKIKHDGGTEEEVPLNLLGYLPERVLQAVENYVLTETHARQREEALLKDRLSKI